MALFDRGRSIYAGIMPGEDDWLKRQREQDILRQFQPADPNGGLNAMTRPGGPMSGLLGSTSRLANTTSSSSPGGGTAFTPGDKTIFNAGEEPSPFRPALPDFDQENMRNQLPDMSNAPPNQQPGQVDPRFAEIIGKAPVKPKSNWLRDVAAGGLAIFGDALSGASDTAHGRGGGYSAVNALAKQWGTRGENYKADLQKYETLKRISNLPGMTSRELQAAALDPKAWAGSMAKDATSRFGAATLNPGDQRYLGDGNGVYQAPTRGELYARSQGFMPGSEAWNRALQDQELGANGPTAFGNQQTLQDDRQADSMDRLIAQTAAARARAAQAQRDRMTVRSAPTYRDLNPPQRSGRGGGGENLPLVKSPADVAKLPKGSRFKTPDGRVMVAR